MSKYMNGREAVVGDVVKGRGKNFKHEIVGILVGITELGPDISEGRILCVGRKHDSPSVLGVKADTTFTKDGKVFLGKEPRLTMEAQVEYCRVDELEGLDHVTGDALVPAAEAAV